MSSINTRHLHHAWRYYLRVKPWYFLSAVIVFGAISLVALRHNNEHMVQLRDTVYAADKNNGDVEASLRTLRVYVYSHMNTSLATGPNAVHPPIQLKYTYERLQQAQQSTLGQGNSTLYTQAQDYCEAQSEIGSDVISCIQHYATDHGAQLATIPDGIYKFDFTSTKWSPDLAGWSIVLTALAAVGFIASGIRWVSKKYL